MRRRHVLAGMMGSLGAAVACRKGLAKEAFAKPPGAIQIELDRPTKINIQSAPILIHESKVRVVSIETVSLSLWESLILSARLQARIVPCTRSCFWISLAAYDRAGVLLGTAQHKEVVRRSRNRNPAVLPHPVLRTLDLDFGVSSAFNRVSTIACAISDPGPRVFKPGPFLLAT